MSAVWLSVVMAVITSAISSQAFGVAHMMKRDNQAMERKADLLSILNKKVHEILRDENPHVDSLDDKWLIVEDYESFYGNQYRIILSDEESRVNLNYATELQLKAFLLLWDRYVNPLKGDEKKLIKAILVAHKPLTAYEELLLAEGVFGKDLQALRDYFTIYSDSSHININTVKPLVLEAFLDALGIDRFVIQKFLKKMAELRTTSSGNNYFSEGDLYPRSMREKLGMRATPENINLFARLTPLLTLDSKTYRLNVQKNKTEILECVFSVSLETGAISVKHWYEPHAA